MRKLIKYIFMRFHQIVAQAEVPDGSKYVQTVPDGKYLCPDRPRRKLPMYRLSCVRQTFVRSCPDFRAFDRLSCVHVQTFVRFLMFPDYVILNARRPPRAFIFGLDILASVWDLSLGVDSLSSSGTIRLLPFEVVLTMPCNGLHSHGNSAHLTNQIMFLLFGQYFSSSGYLIFK